MSKIQVHATFILMMNHLTQRAHQYLQWLRGAVGNIEARHLHQIHPMYPEPMRCTYVPQPAFKHFSIGPQGAPPPQLAGEG